MVEFDNRHITGKPLSRPGEKTFGAGREPTTDSTNIRRVGISPAILVGGKRSHYYYIAATQSRSNAPYCELHTSFVRPCTGRLLDFGWDIH